MKTDPVKNKKQRRTAELKTKPACGTLTYLAECRGVPRKTASGRKQAPSSFVGKIVYKEPPSSS